jgi:SH3-like domain-containing protein
MTKGQGMNIAGRITLAVAATGLAVGTLSPALAAMAGKAPPYFASIAAKKARMRAGPARSYPVSWLYQRADLPVKVIGVFQNGQWYKVEDPDGTQGWIMGGLLSETRTGMVTGQVAELRDRASGDGRIVWRAAPGVVGRLSKCSGGWCYFDIHGRGGFVEQMRLWGSTPGETLP